MTQLRDAIDRSIAKHGTEYPAAHLELLAWYDSKWPDPREAPEVLRVPAETFTAVMEGLGPAYRFCDPRLLEAGWPTVRLRPIGCRTNLVADESVKEPTPDTIENVVGRAAFVKLVDRQLDRMEEHAQRCKAMLEEVLYGEPQK